VKTNRGFTLIELMIVVAILAIIAAVAVPSYLNQVRKSRRSSAEAALQQIALLEERYRADNPSYLTAASGTWTTLGGDPSGTYYTYAATATAATSTTPAYYTLTATATSTGGQTRDLAAGTLCSTLTLTNWDSTNSVIKTVKTPTGCWPGT
jgi:type IV pilus assembly protein PilE